MHQLLDTIMPSMMTVSWILRSKRTLSSDVCNAVVFLLFHKQQFLLCCFVTVLIYSELYDLGAECCAQSGSNST